MLQGSAERGATSTPNTTELPLLRREQMRAAVPFGLPLEVVSTLCARAISPGLNGKRVTKRSSRHTQNSVASLRAEIRDTGKKPVHVLRTTARRPLADETPQGRAVGTSRPRLCAATQLALRGQERALTKKDGKRKTCLFRRRARCPTSCFVGGRASPPCSCF